MPSYDEYGLPVMGSTPSPYDAFGQVVTVPTDFYDPSSASAFSQVVTVPTTSYPVAAAAPAADRTWLMVAAAALLGWVFLS